MDDNACRHFFFQPVNPYHRRYEALRALFVDGGDPEDVAARFGFAPRSLRQLVYEFRQHCRHSPDTSPFFENRESDGLQARRPRRGRPIKRAPRSPIGEG
jgi:hypothetical protein